MAQVVLCYALLKGAQVQMPQLRKAVHQQVLLRVYQFVTAVVLGLEENSRRLVLETGKFVGFQNGLVVTQRFTCQAILVQTNDLRRAWLMTEASFVVDVGQFCTYRNPSACS